MVRWPWRDSRGPEEWSKIPDSEKENYRTATWLMEWKDDPADWVSTKEDYDHADGPYEFISEREFPETEFYEYLYELKEDLRDQLEYPRLKHHAVLRMKKDWKDSGKLADAIKNKGVVKVAVIDVKKCPTCGHEL